MKNETMEMIKKQLTLSMVVWDVHLGREETEKYQRELMYYGILQKNLPEGLDEQASYEYISQVLAEDGVSIVNTVLVTEDAVLADYIYRMAEDAVLADYKQPLHATVPGQVVHRKPGMAVVYYEKGQEKKAYADFIVQGFEEIGIQFLDRVLKRRNRLPWNILYTKRTCVREITLKDLDELFVLYQGEGITDYIEPLYERSKEEVYTANYINHMYYFYGYGMWVVRDKRTGALIGRAGMEHREIQGEMVIELGYVIGKEYQRQGYAYEVCNAIIGYASEQLCLDEIHCFIHPDNYPSIRLAEKLGFKEGRDRLDETGGLLHYRKRMKTDLAHAAI